MSQASFLGNFHSEPIAYFLLVNTAASQAKEKRSMLIMEPERVERASGGGTDDMPIDELSFCKTLLEEKQAQMDVLSEKGIGTTITPTLPI